MFTPANPSNEEYKTLLLVTHITLYFIFGIVETFISILATKRPSVPTVLLAPQLHQDHRTAPSTVYSPAASTPGCFLSAAKKPGDPKHYFTTAGEEPPLSH